MKAAKRRLAAERRPPERRRDPEGRSGTRPVERPIPAAATRGRRADPLALARQVIRIEAAAVGALEKRLGAEFARAVELLAGCHGKVIVSGVGKSGLLAHKLAATLTSTGTAAVFLHPSDALH